MKVIWSSDLEL